MMMYAWLLLSDVRLWRTNTKMVKNKAAAQNTETDGQPLRSYFLLDTHHPLLG